jgi:hypothetical protein
MDPRRLGSPRSRGVLRPIELLSDPAPDPARGLFNVPSSVNMALMLYRDSRWPWVL